MVANKLSNFADTLVPLEVRNSNPGFIVFIKSYFEFLEREFGEYDAIGNLLHYRDIDDTVDQFLDEFRNTYARDLHQYTASNLKSIIKNIRKYYQAKGSEDALKYLFKAVYNSSLEFYYPETGVLKTSTFGRDLSTDSSHITDSDYWQDFSYVMRSGVSAHIYEKMLYALGHPAGLKIFGEFKEITDPLQLFDEDGLNVAEAVLILIIVTEAINAAGMKISVPLSFASEIINILEQEGTLPPSLSNYLTGTWEDYLLENEEFNLLSHVDSNDSNQRSLVFYNNLKQDSNSFIIKDEYLTLLEPATDINDYYWDLNNDVTTGTNTDIVFTAATGNISSSTTDLSIFSAGQIVVIVTGSSVQDGVYKVSGTPTTTAMTVVNLNDSAVSFTGAIAGQTVLISSRTQNTWYTTTLRDQPVLADQTLSVYNIDGISYAATITAKFNNIITVPTSITNTNQLIVFYQGKKIPQTGLSMGTIIGTEQGININPAPIVANIPINDQIDYYAINDSINISTNTVVDASSLTITTNVNNKFNVIVFVDGVELNNNSFILNNGSVEIDSTLYGSNIVDGDIIEILEFDSNHIPYTSFTTAANQILFALNKNIEKRRKAYSGDSILVWNGSTPNPGIDPTPTLANNWNYTGDITSTAHPYEPAPDPLFYWTFDHASDDANTIFGSGTNAANLTIETVGGPNVTKITYGSKGNGIKNTQDGVINPLSNSTLTDLQTQTWSMTIDLMALNDELSNPSGTIVVPMMFGYNGPGGDGWYLTTIPSGASKRQLTMAFSSGSGFQTYSYGAGRLIKNGAWSQFGFSYNNRAVRAYYNGSYIGGFTASGTMAFANSLLSVLGGTSTNFGSDDIAVDEVKLWNSVLSDSDFMYSAKGYY